MKMKHIRWIAVVGLIAIVELQYVWLVNTYKLTRVWGTERNVY